MSFGLTNIENITYKSKGEAQQSLIWQEEKRYVSLWI